MNIEKPVVLSNYAASRFVRLSDARRGASGVIAKVCVDETCQASALARDELELRLLEMGFVEGAKVEVLHEGFIGRDPIAVKLGDMRVALRRREAEGVWVRKESSAA
jgi:ferrous iron transport protein A